MGLDDRNKHIPQNVPKSLVLNQPVPNNLWTLIWFHAVPILMAFLIVMCMWYFIPCMRYLIRCNDDNVSLLCNLIDDISAFVNSFKTPIILLK